MKQINVPSKFANFLVAISLSMFLIGCNASHAQNGSIERIANQRLVELKQNGDLQLVDVRTPSEYQRGYIEGAQLIDFMQPDFTEKVSKLDRDKPIAVYCAVGGRSYQSTNVLRELGFKEVYDLKQGISGWARRATFKKIDAGYFRVY